MSRLLDLVFINIKALVPKNISRFFKYVNRQIFYKVY